MFDPKNNLSYVVANKTTLNEFFESCKDKESADLIAKKNSILQGNLQHAVNLNQTLISTKIMSQFKSMSKVLEDNCSIYFKEKLNVLERKYLVTQLSSLRTSIHLFPILMRYFFKSLAKLQEFWTSQRVHNKFVKPLAAQYLTLLGRSDSAH